MQGNVAALEDTQRQDHEEDAQDGASPLLQLVDELITHEADQAFE